MTSPIDRIGGGESDVVQRAREVAALVRAARDEIDRLGRMPDAVVEAIHEAGLFRMAVPASVGGLEVDVLEFSRVVEEIARADGSAAWCVMQGATSGTIAAYMEPDAAAEVFGDPRVVFAAGTPLPAAGRADAVDGGYRVSGRFAFASGCRHSNWVVGRCSVYGTDGERRQDLGAWANLLVPMSEARIEDTWDVRGMRGTASDAYVIEDVFVPERFMVSFARKPREPGRLYRVGDLQMAHLSMASAALGMARDCLDEFAALASGKRVAWTGASVGQSGVAQVEVARATAKVDAALALRDQAAHSMWEAAATSRPSPESRARSRLAIIHGVDMGLEAIDTIYRLSGTTAIFGGHPIQRHFQDVNVLSQQIVGRLSYYETIGKALLGQEFEAGWL